MDKNSLPRILAAERVAGALAITFDDDTTVLYSAALLHHIRFQAEVLETEAKPEADDNGAIRLVNPRSG